ARAGGRWWEQGRGRKGGPGGRRGRQVVGRSPGGREATGTSRASITQLYSRNRATAGVAGPASGRAAAARAAHSSWKPAAAQSRAGPGRPSTPASSRETAP